MLKPSSVMIRRAALAGSLVAATGAGCTKFFHSFSSGRKVTQGLKISTNEKPGCRIASTRIDAVSFGSPEKQRAMKFAPDASAITNGWNGRNPVPPGDKAVSNSGSVVGDGWPLVMP